MLYVSQQLCKQKKKRSQKLCADSAVFVLDIVLYMYRCCRLCARKSLLWKTSVYLSGQFDLNSPTGFAHRGQKNSNRWCLTQAIILFDVSYLTKNHRIMKCDCLVFSKDCFMREETERGTEHHFCKLKKNTAFFSFFFLKQTTFSTRDSKAFCPGYQPECGQSLSLSFLAVESASQHLSLVYFSLWSPCAGRVKCYYR